MLQPYGFTADGDDDLNPDFVPEDYAAKAAQRDEKIEAHVRESVRDEKAAELQQGQPSP